MKTALLYISLGRYDTFFKGFYKSAKKHMLPGHEKHFFVFTDSKSILNYKEKDITVIKQKKLGWPFDTLMRFEMFCSIENSLKEYDYIYFLNSNILFLRDACDEILPGNDNGGLAAATYFIRDPDSYTYDRNPECRAYIPYGTGRIYYQGGFNGGTAEEYLKMARVLKGWAKEDLQKGIIAKWHDESYLNRYLIDRNPLIIPRNYMYPQEWGFKDSPGKVIAVLRDKNNPFYGGAKWLRGETDKKNNVFTVFMKKPLWTLKLILKHFIIIFRMYPGEKQ